MRLLLVVLGVTVASELAGAGAAPAVAPTPSNADGSSVSTARPRKDVSYSFTAEFGIGYEVEWTEESGSRFESRSEWRLDRGTHEVNVGSVGKGRLGRITIFGSDSKNPITGGWADGSAVGTAKATVHRRWVQTGGDTWTPGCANAKPKPFRPLPDDCGGRQYLTQAALIRAEVRRGNVTLDMVKTTENPGSANANADALAITAVGRVFYKKCSTSGNAPELPANFGLLLRRPDWIALRALKLGDTRRVQRQWPGDCKASLARNPACRFTLDMHVDIRRRS